MKITKKDLESIRKELLAILIKYTSVKDEYPDFTKMFSIKQSSSNPYDLQPYYPGVKLPMINLYISTGGYSVDDMPFTCSMNELSMTEALGNLDSNILKDWVIDMYNVLHLRNRKNLSDANLERQASTLFKVSLSTLVNQTQVITNCIKGTFDQKLLSECTFFKLVNTYTSKTTRNIIYTYMSK